MDRERLARLLEEPGKVARKDITDLKALTEQYPWFSGAHLLKAVGEQAAGDVLADETLRKSAAHIPSRAVLFDLKDTSMQQAAAQLRQQQTASDRGETSLEESMSEVNESSVRLQPSDPIPEKKVSDLPRPAEEPPPADLEAEASAEIEATSTGSELNEENVSTVETELAKEPSASVEPNTTEESPVATPEKEGTPVPAEEQDEPAKEELDKQIMEAAIASVYDLTWQEKIPARPAFEKTPLGTEKPPVPADPTSSVEATITPKQKITSGTRLKFTDWLATDTAQGPSEKEIVATGAPDPSTKVDQEIRSRTASPPAAAADPRTLIDRFIEHETPPPSRKAEFYTPQQAAKKSLDDSAGLVSETLAKIYEKQGNFQKASEAYRKLALKYPEKSAYFAALSKSLEGRSNV